MKQRRRYTNEFKTQVVELANAGLIHTRKGNASALSPLQVRSEVQGAESDMEAAGELKRLRREVSKCRIDKDIIKNAAMKRNG